MIRLIVSALILIVSFSAAADKDFGGYKLSDPSDIDEIAAELKLSKETVRTLHPETIRNLRLLMKVPSVYTASDIEPSVIVGPGEIYDSMWMDIRDDRIWIGDRGKDTHDGKSGSVVSMNLNGGDVKREIGFSQLSPLRDIAFAPDSFGFGPENLVVFSQPAVGFAGSLQDHLISRVIVDEGAVERTICELPAGSSRGTELVTGPDGSEFEGHMFVGLASSKSVVKVSPDGSCTPLVTDLPGFTMGLAFTPDGKHLLVGLKDAEQPWVDERTSKGSVIKVDRAGSIVGDPVATGLEMPMSFAYAPKQWGRYAGQLFLVDAGAWQDRPPRGNLLKPDARIYRINDSGEKELVASGFANAIDIKFNKKDLFVSDPQGDYYGGVFIVADQLADFQPGRELPDSIVYKLTYVGR